MELTAVADQHDWRIIRTFKDEATGPRSRKGQPGFDALHKAISHKEIDLVVSWSANRLAKSLQGLVRFLGDLQTKGIHLYLHKKRLDTTTPEGQAMFGMLEVFADFERSMLQERQQWVRVGQTRAKAKGKRLGQPPKATDLVVAEIQRDHQGGMSIRAIAKKHDLSVGLVHKALSMKSDGDAGT